MLMTWVQFVVSTYIMSDKLLQTWICINNSGVALRNCGGL